MSKWIVKYNIYNTIVLMSPDLSDRSYKECLAYVNKQSNPKDYSIIEFNY